MSAIAPLDPDSAAGRDLAARLTRTLTQIRMEIQARRSKPPKPNTPTPSRPRPTTPPPSAPAQPTKSARERAA